MSPQTYDLFSLFSNLSLHSVPLSFSLPHTDKYINILSQLSVTHMYVFRVDDLILDCQIWGSLMGKSSSLYLSSLYALRPQEISSIPSGMVTDIVIFQVLFKKPYVEISWVHLPFFKIPI